MRNAFCTETSREKDSDLSYHHLSDQISSYGALCQPHISFLCLSNTSARPSRWDQQEFAILKNLAKQPLRMDLPVAVFPPSRHVKTSDTNHVKPYESIWHGYLSPFSHQAHKQFSLFILFSPTRKVLPNNPRRAWGATSAKTNGSTRGLPEAGCSVQSTDTRSKQTGSKNQKNLHGCKDHFLWSSLDPGCKDCQGLFQLLGSVISSPCGSDFVILRLGI